LSVHFSQVLISCTSPAFVILDTRPLEERLKAWLPVLN
jgi:hypothetical protein